MREIEYRGKRADNGEWVYGSLINKFDVDALCVSSSYIIERSAFSISADSDTTLYDVACLDDYYEVDEGTVGQFTGLKDKNGVKIYEGDIVKMLNIDEYPMQIKWHKEWARFIFYNLVNKAEMNLFTEQCEVIGNIYDNPELIKESE